MAKLFGVERGSLDKKARDGVDVLVDEHELAYIRYLMQMEKDMAPGRKSEYPDTVRERPVGGPPNHGPVEGEQPRNAPVSKFAFFLNGQFEGQLEKSTWSYEDIAERVNHGKPSEHLLTVVFKILRRYGAHLTGTLRPGENLVLPFDAETLSIDAVVTNRA